MITAKVRVSFQGDGQRRTREFTFTHKSTADALIAVHTVVAKVYERYGDFRLYGSKVQAVS